MQKNKKIVQWEQLKRKKNDGGFQRMQCSNRNRKSKVDNITHQTG